MNILASRMKYSFLSLIILSFLVLTGVANAQVNLLLNRDYVGNASEKQLMQVIEKGVDLNQVSTRYGHTPLTVMVDYRLRKDTKSAMRLISIMLERGADPNIPVGPTRGYNKYWVGSTVLHKAVEIGYMPLVLLLLEVGANPDIVPPVKGIESLAPLHRAVRKRDFETIKLLLVNRADPDVQQYPDSKYAGRTPLMTAVIARSPTMVRLLIEGGADPNIQASKGRGAGRTPLLNTTFRPQSIRLAKILLEAGADPNIPDDYGNSPITMTAEGSTCKVIYCHRSPENPELHELLLQYR